MKTKTVILAAVLLGTGLAAVAQSRDDERREQRREEARDAYRRGYDEGYERGYRKGVEEGERRAREAMAPPPPAVPRLGPIRVTGATYGSPAHKCDATRYVARGANGKMSYSFEVSNEMCGDPSHGDRKELAVTYRCGEVIKTAAANEHRNIYLDCRS
jgi:hypothetical protein